jgi:integrase
LSDLAVELFKSIKRREGPYVFQAMKPYEGPMDGRVLTKAVRMSQDHIGIDQWTAHDLRRTAATKLAEISVQARHVSAVLNHRVEGVTAEVYDQYTYLPEKRAALDAWADRLRVILAGAAAVPIRGRA